MTAARERPQENPRESPPEDSPRNPSGNSPGNSPGSPGRRLGGRTVLTLGLLVILAVVAFRETRPHVFGRPLDLYGIPTDFMVYYRAGEALAAGGNIYDGPLYGPLPFTYPPFAGTVFRLLVEAPPEMAATFWQLLCVGALVSVILGVLVQRGYRLDAGTAALGAAVAVAALALSPVRDSFFYGQINLLLMLLVSLDFLRRRDRLTGIGTGIAAGLKLTPAFFILVFLVQRRWRDAATATAAFAATVAVGLLTVPDAMRFWTSAIFDSSRIGSDTVSASQSLRAFTLRTLDSPLGAVLLWAGLVLLVLAALCVAVVWATRRNNQALVMSLAGIGACLVSPFSWHHHWVWIVPLAVCLVDIGAQLGRQVPSARRPPVVSWLLSQAVMVATLLVVVVTMVPFVSHQVAVRWSFMGQPNLPAPLTDMWILWGVLIMVAFAVPAGVNLLRSRRRGPAPAAHTAEGPRAST